MEDVDPMESLLWRDALYGLVLESITTERDAFRFFEEWFHSLL
jgi:hypothetical protein